MYYLQCLTSLQHVNVNVQNIVKTMKDLKDHGTRWQTSQQGNLQGLLLSVYFHFFFILNSLLQKPLEFIKTLNSCELCGSSKIVNFEKTDKVFK